MSQSSKNQEDLDPIDNPEEPATLSLMGGVVKPEGLPEAELEFDAMRSGRNKISQGTLLILLVVVIAAGSIYAMRIGQGDLSAGGVPSEVMTKIEAALARSKPSPASAGQPTTMRASFRDTQSIVNMFNADVSNRQVPIEYVQKNPFALAGQTPAAELSQDNPADANRLRDLQRKLQGEFDRLQLQSVMANARIPVVVIDGQFYKTGQKVGEFTITAIHDRGVDMEAQGMKFSLSMQDQIDKQRNRSR